MTVPPTPPLKGPVTVPPIPKSAGKDSPKRKQARAALVDVLFDARGNRRLPADKALVAAIAACGPEDLWWVCEANSRGPLYLLPTREWITALVAFVDEVKAKSVLEVAAGDGFVSACLQRRRPALRVIASDDFSWTKPDRRMNDDDRKEFARFVSAGALKGIQPLPIVEKLSAVAAVKKHQPDLVLVSWAPPGTLVERVIRAPSKLVLDISVDGDVCGNGNATWRFEKEFLDGPLEQRALCRLDQHPDAGRATRATLYFGKRHKRFGVEKSGGLAF